MSGFSAKALTAMGSMVFSAAALLSPTALAITVHHHVIKQTSTGMIDTVYDSASHVHSVNTFVNARSAPVVIAARTRFVAPSDAKTSGAWSVDPESFPASIPVQTDADGNLVNDANIIDVPQTSPNVPVAGYSGPVIQTYISYGQNGAPKNTLYVQFWYSNGLLDTVTVQTSPPPASGGGGGCGGTGQRPCPDPDKEAS